QRGTAEIHLATGFQNLLYDGGFLPQDLQNEMFDWLRQNCADERTPGQTEEQFLYKTRKKAYGPFKRRLSRTGRTSAPARMPGPGTARSARRVTPPGAHRPARSG